MSRELLRQVARLLLPVECPGCDAPDVLLCQRCSRLLECSPRRVDDGAPALIAEDGATAWPVWAVGAYEESLRDIVLAWKEGGRLDLTAPLREAMREQAVAVSRWGGIEGSDVTMDRASTSRGRSPLARPLVVVPVPSSPQSVRRRGEDLVARLADAVAAGLGVGESTPLLRMGVRHRDQVGLGSVGRTRNLRGSLSATGHAKGLAADAILVDDVLTTGSTLAEAARCLGRVPRGPRVVGAFVLAATPSPVKLTAPKFSVSPV